MATSGIPILPRSSLASSIPRPARSPTIRFRCARTGPLAQGGLQIVLDKQGRVYYGNMSQMQIARFDPKTGKIETFKLPVADDKIGSAHLTMIDPNSQDVDGQLWINVAEGTDESGGTYHIDLAKNIWTKVTYPQGSPSARAYDVVANSQNNMYGMNMGNNKIWMTDGKTLKTTWFDLTLKNAAAAAAISTPRIVSGAAISPAMAWPCSILRRRRSPSGQPTPGMWPYDAEYDDKAYTWFAGMESDLAVRFKPKPAN